MMDLWVEKLVVLFLAFTIMSISGLLPLYMGEWYHKKGKKGEYYISIINSFGGGVFFGTYFMFMAPSARDTLVEKLLVPYDIFYPIPELMACLGFFMMLYIDKSVMYATKKSDDKDQSEESLTKNNKQNDNADETNIILSSIKYNYRHSDSCCSPSSPKVDRKLKQFAVYSDTNNYNSKDGQLNKEQLKSVSLDVEKATLAIKEKEAEKDKVVDHLDDMAARPYIFLTACSIDCLFSGMSLGLLSGPGDIWILFIGVISHEIVVCFSFGLRLLKMFSNKKIAGIILFYAITTPIGILIGLGIYQLVGAGDEIEILGACCEALAGGIYIYVTFLEILNEELTHDSGISKTIAVTMGFIFMCVTVMINSVELGADNENIIINATAVPMFAM